VCFNPHLTEACYAIAGVAEAQSLSVQTIIDSALAGPQDGPAAQANADLLLSCLQGKPSAEELAQTVHHILGFPSAGATESDAPSDADDDAIITGKYHDAPVGAPARGAALAVLLVQRLLQTAVQESRQVLWWQTPALDSLAGRLANTGDIARNDVSQPTASPASANSGSQEAAAEAADLAASVAAAPLEASERTNAAQQTPVSHSGTGVSDSPPQEHGALSDADTSSAQLLGLLIAGKGNMSLLSDHAMQQVFSQLKCTLDTAGSTSGKRQTACPNLAPISAHIRHQTTCKCVVC